MTPKLSVVMEQLLLNSIPFTILTSVDFSQIVVGAGVGGGTNEVDKWEKVMAFHHSQIDNIALFLNQFLQKKEN